MITEDHLPITVAQARDWCRIDDNDDDSLVLALIYTAATYAESVTGRDLAVDCPEPVKQACAVMVADLYSNREGQLVGSKTVDALLAPYRKDLL